MLSKKTTSWHLIYPTRVARHPQSALECSFLINFKSSLCLYSKSFNCRSAKSSLVRSASSPYPSCPCDSRLPQTTPKLGLLRPPGSQTAVSKHSSFAIKHVTYYRYVFSVKASLVDCQCCHNVQHQHGCRAPPFCALGVPSSQPNHNHFRTVPAISALLQHTA